jgi:hypothetical protein
VEADAAEEGLTNASLCVATHFYAIGRTNPPLASSCNECAIVRVAARLPMSPRPIDAAVAARARGKFVSGEGDRPAAAEDFPARFWARGFELERILTLGDVAELTGLSEDGIRRHYGYLIRRLSPRRVGMKLRDALTIGDAFRDPPLNRSGST